jgi:hypothetical protein
VTEALTALHDIGLSKEISFNDMIMYGDALQIINMIKATSKN